MIKNIKILGHEYKIEYDPDLSSNNTNSPGAFNSKLSLIRIDNNSCYSNSKIEECIFHEILEGVIFHLQIEILHKDLSSISEVLYQTLKEKGLLTLDEL